MSSGDTSRIAVEQRLDEPRIEPAEMQIREVDDRAHGSSGGHDHAQRRRPRAKVERYAHHESLRHPRRRAAAVARASRRPVLRRRLTRAPGACARARPAPARTASAARACARAAQDTRTAGRRRAGRARRATVHRRDTRCCRRRETPCAPGRCVGGLSEPCRGAASRTTSRGSGGGCARWRAQTQSTCGGRADAAARARRRCRGRSPIEALLTNVRPFTSPVSTVLMWPATTVATARFEIQRDAGVLREVVERAERQHAERRVRAGDDRRHRVDRPVAPTRHDGARAGGVRFARGVRCVSA